jgi:DNA-binding protein HU-beta
MTHKELTAELAKKMDWSQVQTSEVLECLVAIINSKLSNSYSINIPNFGLLETKQMQERVSVNPVSKQRFLVPPKIVPAFRPSITMKKKLKNQAENE